RLVHLPDCINKKTEVLRIFEASEECVARRHQGACHTMVKNWIPSSLCMACHARCFTCRAMFDEKEPLIPVDGATREFGVV
ncbi:hypothetical protein A2U01_0022927, partial [Trifolium medium]|nr:hypothetical protein [Trifolium medium]